MRLGPRARNVKQPALLLNLISVTGGHVARKDTVGDMDHVHHIPFASFGQKGWCSTASHGTIHLHISIAARRRVEGRTGICGRVYIGPV